MVIITDNYSLACFLLSRPGEDISCLPSTFVQHIIRNEAMQFPQHRIMQINMQARILNQTSLSSTHLRQTTSLDKKDTLHVYLQKLKQFSLRGRKI
jgi:hypothetical protein